MQRYKAADTIATIIGVAVVWLACFKLNDFAFSQFAHSSRAHWIFLPAALRILAVLLFDRAGAVGLMFGAYLTLPHSSTDDLPYELILSISSGIGPLVAVVLGRRVFSIAADLSGLRGKHIVVLSVAGAAANSALVNGVMASMGRWHGDVQQLFTIFIGDMLGTAIMLTAVVGAIVMITRVSRSSRIKD